MLHIWTSWLKQRRYWIPTIAFIPVLYVMGWLISQPLRLIFLKLSNQDLSLIGTIISFILFALLLPSWIQIRWGKLESRPLLHLSRPSRVIALGMFFRGLLIASTLLFLLLLPAHFFFWVHWVDGLTNRAILHSIILGLGVGIAEELIFRGWLLVELSQICGLWRGIFAQAFIFSLVHIRFDQGLFSMIGLLIGLFLLGLALALRANLDEGSLWGCVGLHGGLVGGWAVLSNGVIQLSSDIPGWLFGFGGIDANPLGGFLAIVFLLVLIFSQRNAFAIAG